MQLPPEKAFLEEVHVQVLIKLGRLCGHLLLISYLAGILASYNWLRTSIIMAI